MVRNDLFLHFATFVCRFIDLFIIISIVCLIMNSKNGVLEYNEEIVVSSSEKCPIRIFKHHLMVLLRT